MKILKLINAYLIGNKLDRLTIWTKLLNKVGFQRKKKQVQDFKYLNMIDISSLISIETINNNVYTHYMKHEYNFLGLGWKNWSKNSESSYVGYKKIAWYTDIKSGYVFENPNVNSGFLKNIPQGTDVKIPWELARMQHWPQLALYGLNNNVEKQKIKVEFQSQMMDFMERSPVGKGIHFFCAMEVAIRAINLMIAYDIISQYEDAVFEDVFKSEFETYLYNHLQAIINRLEKNYFTGHTGNHYLADLCGLLWICIYFRSKTTKKLVATVIDELRREAIKQFTDSGSCYECSTGYHLLSSEILGLSFFAIGNIDKEALRNEDIKQLSDLKSVIDVFEARDQRIIQIGDNDSGRILKLNPIYMGEKEDCLNPIEVKCMLGYMTNQTKKDAYSTLLNSYHLNTNVHTFEKEYCFEHSSYTQMIDDSECMYEKTHALNLKLGNIGRIEYISDFGLVKVICENADIFIRAVPEYKRMDTSHAHDDVFSYQIVTDNRRIREDLGSIVYTSDKEIREYFASARSHGVPKHSIDMVKRLDTFETSASAVGNVVIDENRISVEAKWDEIVHKRVFELDSEGIKISDFSNEDFEIQGMKEEYYSLGYGQLYKR